MATSIANPSLTNLQVNTWTNVYNSAPVAGFSGTVRIVVEVNSGTLKLSNYSTGVVAATGYGNLYDGNATSIAFEGTQAQVNAALQSLQAYNTNANASPTLKISAVKGGQAYNPATEHYYEFVSAPNISWTDAKTAASNKTFNGLKGYLVTITSEAENSFVASKSGGKEGWIGASDVNIEGTWQWYTGPEGGPQPNGTTPYTTLGYMENGIYKKWRYDNFASGEPNDYNQGIPGEDYAYMRPDGTWNDYPNTNSVAGYLVEYGGYSNDNPTEVAQSTSSTLTVVATPVITSNGGDTTASINYAENGTAAVTTVTATDADSGDSKTYSIAGGADASSFDINSSTGVLTFKTSPNFEAPTDSDTNNSYQVTVRVTDGVVNGQTRYDEQTLTINVTNVNDLPTTSGSLPDSIATTEEATVDVDLSALSFSDQDPSDTFILKLAASKGTLAATGADGVTVVGSGSNTLTLSGTPAAVGAYLDTASNIQYTGALNDNGTPAATIAVSYKDSAMASFQALGSAIAVNITAVNDAPVIASEGTAATLPGVHEDEDSATNTGASVNSLFAPRFTDVDSGDSMSGIVVVGNASTATEGAWEYSTDSGTSWHAIGAVSTSSGLALSSTTQLRFAPAKDWSGTPGALTVKLLDNTQASFTSGATPVTLDTIASSAASTNAVNLTTSVAAVNDLPEITSPTAAASLTETDDWDSSVTASGALTGTLAANDDKDGSTSITYGIRGGTTTTVDSVTTVTKTGFYGTLTLNTTTKEWTYAPSNFTAINALNDGQTATDTFDFSITDSAGATASQALTITYTGTNDTPVVKAGLDPIPNQTFNGTGSWSYQIPADIFTDADGTNLTYTVQVVDGSGNVLDTISDTTGTDPAKPSNWLIFNEASRTLSGIPTATAPLPLNIKITATDGTGVVSDTFTVTLDQPPSDDNLTPGNLAPTTTDDHLSTTGTAAVTLTVNDFGSYSDANGNALAAVKIVTPPSGTSGTLKLDSVAITGETTVSVADINANKLTFEPGTSPASIGFQVGDGSTFSSTHSLTIDVGSQTAAVTLDASTQTTAAANAWTAVYSGNTEVLTGYTGTVRVVVEATGGKIKLDYADAGAVTSAGLTAITTGYGSLTDGSASSIAFEGSLANVNIALQQLQANLATNPGMTLTVSAIKGGSAFNPANGHYYEAVDFNPALSDNTETDTITWAAAKTAAEVRTFNGLTGYLATITSAEENAFILSKLPKDGWIGASDAAVEGDWKWVTGPEAGTPFWSGAAGGTAVGGLYANWNTNQPDNWTGGGGAGETDGEDFAQFFATGGDNPGSWNDLQADYGQAYYVVEYGGIGTVLEQASRTITLTKLDAAPVLSINGDAAYTENAAPKALNPALDLTDVDSTTLATATVTLSAGKVTGDVLALTNVLGTMGNIVGVYDANNGVLNLSSANSTATLAEWETALKAVTFYSTSDNPGTSRTVSWQVNDGTNDSNTGTTSIAVTPVNDAPVATKLSDVTHASNALWELDVDGTDNNLFTDAEGQTIIYSATLADGSDLPIWLSFDATTHTFSGNPPAGLPYLNLKVIGTDGTNENFTTFTLNLADATSGAAAANTQGEVSISGSTTLGATLTAAAPTDADGLTGTVTYQWQKSSDGSNWSDIGNATSNTFTITQAESKQQLRVQAFYNDAGGFAEAPVSNALTVPALNLAGTVTVNGSPLPGQTLVASLSDGNGIVGVTPTYTWYRVDTSSAETTEVGGDFSAYTLTNDDGNKYITVKVTYTDNEGTAETVSASSGQIQLGAEPPKAENDTNTATEAGGLDNGTAGSNASGNVLDNDTDPNTSDSKAVTGLRTGSSEGLGDAAVLTAGAYTLAGTYGTLSITASTGAYTYTVNQTAANVQALKADEQVTDVFNYTVTDGTLLSDVGLLTITLTGADDTLVVSNLPATFTVTEDVAMAIDFGNSFNLSDPDFPGAATVTLEASEGTLSGASALDVTVSGSGTGTLTLVGTLGNISTWLKTIGSVQYTSALNDSGTPGATLTLKSGGATLGTANINITPVNDAPVISSNGGDTPTPISYAENGTDEVTTVTATDPDSGDTKTFSISGGDDADLFRIDPGTGALTFRNSPNFEIPADADNNNSYIVTVKVTDFAGLTDEQTLTINVTNDTSANDPIETGGAGSQTITAPADDAKINVTGSGTTTITNPAGSLTIANSGSGTVVVEGLKDGATVNTSGTGATKISDPKGSLTVANSGTGTVTVDGLNTDSVLTTTGSGPTAVTNPDGNLSVANSGTGTVTVSGLNAGASLTANGTGPTQVNDPEGHLTVNNSGSGVVTVDGLNTGSVLTTTGTGSTAVTNPDGNLEVANSGTGTVTVSGLNPGASLTASGTGPTQVNDPEGHLTVNNSGSGTVTVNGLNTDSVLTTTGSGPTTVTNPDGNLSVVNNGTGTVTVKGLNTGANLNTSGTGSTQVSDPEGNLTVNNSGSGTVTVHEIMTGGVLTATGTGPTSVTHPDGNLSVVNSGTGTVTVNGLNPNASLTANGTGPTLVNDPEGNLTVRNSGSGTVTVAGLNDDAVLNSNSTGPIQVTNPDEDVSVVNNGSGTVSVDDMKAGAVLSSSGTGPVTISNPEGNLRVANTGSGTVTVEDLKPGATLTATGTKPVNVDLSHLSSGQTITIDNDGSGVVNLVNVPEGVIVLTTGSSGSGGINYAPTITDVPGAAQAVTAGTAAALADFKVADKDASQTLTVTLKATNGTMGGLTDADTNTDGIQLTGTADDINTALADATFTAAGAGAASITISVTDGVVSSPTTATYSLNAVPAPSSGSAPTPAPSPEGAIQNGVSNTTVTTDGGAQTTTTGTIGTVPVVETVTVTADGNTVRELVYVPTTTGTGAGSSTPTVLPLLYESVAGSTSNTTVSLPSGVGLVSVGDRTPTTTTGQQGLITLIQSTVSDGDPSRTDMLGGGQSFLDTLPQDATLWVNKIQLTAPTALPNAPSVPVVVSGAARTEASTSTADKLEALVIDATALPQGTVIELHDIDFAVVVGNGVFVRGGSGANVVYGGAGSQYILLGEADDVLYGGADDDTVGSEGGNDRIFGNAGNDTLFGGEGEDLLHGGADTDVATFTGSISRYEIVRDHGKTIVRSLDRADDVDTVINVETLRFDDADYTVENAPHYTVIASLYGEVLDRQADLAGFQYWAERYAAGESIGDIALSFLYSAEYQSGSGLQFSALSTAAQLDLFYLHFLGRTPDTAGHAYWMDRIEDGMSLNDVAHSFVVSTEMQGAYVQPTAWEFLL